MYNMNVTSRPPSLQPARSRAEVPQIIARASNSKRKGADEPAQRQTVQYGADWYEQTRRAAKPVRTVREELERRRQANLEANNGKERKDLYTDNWAGSEYRGSPFNILTLLAALFFLVPIAGLAFAYFTYGDLWG